MSEPKSDKSLLRGVIVVTSLGGNGELVITCNSVVPEPSTNFV